MQTVIIVIHLMVVVALVVAVLLQRSEGGALGIGGGGGFMTGRGQANALTRATAILGAIFFVTSLTLTVMASWGTKQKSIFDTPAAGQSAPAGQTAPAKGGNVLDELKKVQPEAPAAPTAPEAPKSQ
jgi:preprotein translocase subunit SecG